MSSFSIVLPAAFVFLSTLAASTSSRAESYARVCVTTIDPGLNEAAFAPDSSPSPEKKLLVHLDASVGCAAVIVPLEEKSSRLANGWRPQIALLAAWTEKVLPNPPVSWNWTKASSAFEIWTLFFKADGAEFQEIQKLVTAMQNPKLSEEIVTRQTQMLCERLAARMTGNARISEGPKADATLVGGTTRQADFPWRDYARKVALNDALEGELVLRHGR